ncbi:hypothetical protein ACWGF2_11305 [Streptomyces sp. NPDC054919]
MAALEINVTRLAATTARLQLQTPPMPMAGGHHGPMDQGMAAVLAGIGALVGALVGAVASFRGAKVGAERALEAVKVQVERQALAEHAHWAREHRRTTLIDVLSNAADMTQVLHQMERLCGRNEGIPTQLSATMPEHITQMGQNVVHLSVWGPDDGVEACNELLDAINHQYEAALRWSRAVRTDSDTESAQRAYRQADEARIGAYARFAFIAKVALRDGVEASRLSGVRL